MSERPYELYEFRFRLWRTPAGVWRDETGEVTEIANRFLNTTPDKTLVEQSINPPKFTEAE